MERSERSLRQRQIDPISHTSIPRQRLYWLNGEHYDVFVLARTLHATGKAIDPINQTPLRTEELHKIDLHLQQLGSHIKSVQTLRHARPSSPPTGASEEEELAALEEQCNEYMEQLYQMFDPGELPSEALLMHILPPLRCSLRRMIGIDRGYTVHLIDTYVRKLQGPSNLPTVDMSGYLLGLCIQRLRRLLSEDVQRRPPPPPPGPPPAAPLAAPPLAPAAAAAAAPRLLLPADLEMPFAALPLPDLSFPDLRRSLPASSGAARTARLAALSSLMGGVQQPPHRVQGDIRLSTPAEPPAGSLPEPPTRSRSGMPRRLPSPAVPPGR